MALTGSSVDSLTSQSAGAYAFTNTLAARPTFSSSAINGKPGLLFTAASAQCLFSNAAGAALSASRMGFSLYYVAYRTGLGTQRTPWSCGTIASTTNVMDSRLGIGGSNVDSASRTLGGGNNTTGTRSVGASPVVISDIFGPTTIATYVNGVLSISAANSVDPGALDRMVIGGYRLFASDTAVTMDGGIGDLLIFAAVHTATERQAVEQYLTLKYA